MSTEVCMGTQIWITTTGRTRMDVSRDRYTCIHTTSLHYYTTPIIILFHVHEFSLLCSCQPLHNLRCFRTDIKNQTLSWLVLTWLVPQTSSIKHLMLNIKIHVSHAMITRCTLFIPVNLSDKCFAR